VVPCFVPKFYGDDDKWEGWYKQWRAYLQAKEWLATAEHPQGPGATDFNLKINSLIYNALVNLCQKGKAITYIEQAAEFDGHGANQQLLLRYEGFSKQKLQFLKKCIETMRHVSGTNMSHHVDKFEKICELMVNCGYIPDEEQKIDWFMASVYERTYEAMHALPKPNATGHAYLWTADQAVHTPMLCPVPALPNRRPKQR
jgi:hypothetical protein